MIMKNEKIDYDYLLSNVQTQINNFDNKANILLAIVSITFTLSLLLLESITGLSDTRRLLCIIFLSLYLLSSLITLTFLILVIFPRKSKKNKVDVNYYRDVTRLSKQDFVALLNDEKYDYISSLQNQIYVNSVICDRKHKWLVAAIWSLLPLIALLITNLYLIII